MRNNTFAAVAGIILFIIPLLGFMGCTAGTRNVNEADRFRIGTQGLYMQFLSNAPQARIYDDQGLNAVIQIENRGAYELDGSANRIYLDGFSTDVINGIPISGKIIGKLEGKSRYNTQGGVTIIDFQGTIRNLGSRGIDRLPQTIKATVCYGYETIAVVPVCVDPNPFSTRSEEVVCSGGRAGFTGSVGTGAPSTGLGGGQGAPISVTNVLTESIPDRSKFKITIQNAGGGTVFKDGFMYLDRCNPYDPTGIDSFRDANFVSLVDVSIDGNSIKGSCTPQKDDGNVQLINNQATIYCEYNNIPQENPYVTPLTITLRYGYRTAIVRQVTLLSVPE